MNLKKWWADKENRIWLIKLLVIIVLAMGVMALIANTVDAAPTESDGYGTGNAIFVGDHMKMDNSEDAHYILDTSEKTKEEMDQGLGEDFMDTIKAASPFAIAYQNMVYGMAGVTDLIFVINQQMTNLMIGVLNFGFDSNIIDHFIDMIAGVVQNISGLSGTHIGGGVFGTFVMFAIVMTTAVAGYQFFFRRSTIAGFQTLFKSILSLAVAFILIANFGTVMRGMNDMTTWISASALTGTTNFVTNDNRSTDEMMDAVDKNMWDLFIGKPYLVMQYGTDDVEQIGEERINELLEMPPGQDRTDYVQDIEVGERDNQNMTIPNLFNRLSFTLLYSTTNIIMSIPVYGIALAHILFEFWFLLISFIAPFALIWSVFPGQFGVLQRYGIELVYPLLLKVLVSFVMVFIFGIGFVAYQLPAAEGMPQYFTAAIFQFVLFALVFFLRKRIKAIFSSGQYGPFNLLRNDIQDLRNSMEGVSSKLGKGARIAGHVAAGVVTNGATAMTSARIEKHIALKESQKSGKSASQPMADIKKPTSQPTADVKQSASQPMADIKTESVANKVQTVLKDDDMSKPFADLKKQKLDVKSEEEQKKGADAK